MVDFAKLQVIVEAYTATAVNALNKAKATIENVGKAVKKASDENKIFEKGWRSIETTAKFALAGIGLWIGILALSSGKLQAQMDFLGQSFGRILKPAGDLIAEGLKPLTKFLKETADNIDRLNPTLKTLYSWILFLVGGFVSIITAIGLFSANFLGIATIASGVGLVLAKIGAVIGSLATPIGWVIAAIGLFALAWATNFANIQQHVQTFWNGLIHAFNGIVQMISGVLDVLYGILTVDTTKIVAGAKKIWEGFKQFLDGIWHGVLGSIAAFSYDAILAVINWGKKWFNELSKIFEGLLSAAFDFGKNFVQGIINGIKSIGHLITQTLTSFIPSVSGFVSSAASIAGGILKGSRAVGGSISETGLYQLHAGEQVIPSSQNISNQSFSPTVNITVNGGGMNANDLAREVSRILQGEYRRGVLF